MCAQSWARPALASAVAKVISRISFVRSILGKACFELFESGKITLEKMTVDGRIRRLSELA